MRRRVVWASAAIAVFAVLFLLTHRKARPALPPAEANASAVSVTQSVRNAVADKPKGSRPAPSGLAAAYAPGVVVITNGVLEPDPRHNFNPRPGMADYEGWERYREERGKASRSGAKGKATFHVVDTDGNSVAYAEISAGFSGGSGGKGLTDGEGLFVVEGNTLHGASLLYTINKQGYYQTRATYQLGKHGYRCVENGRWIPWNPTLRVTLKKIRKPIPMYTKRIDMPIPVQDHPVGFDFEVGDWVVPYGKGISFDMQLTYTWATGEDTWRRHDFTIEFTQSLDGAYIAEKDDFCLFMSEYEARQDGSYQKEFQYAYERTDTKILLNNRLDEQQIMVFRVRTEKNQQGGISSARYGKIYGPFQFAQGREKLVRFTYYFNPTPNDRNIEFDGKNNLFDPMWRDLSWPR